MKQLKTCSSIKDFEKIIMLYSWFFKKSYH
jgi:hypothetical protein